jgi:hypothetical protein
MASTGKGRMRRIGASRQLALSFQPVAQMTANSLTSSVIQAPCAGLI